MAENYTIKRASNLLLETIPDLIDLTHYYGTSAEGSHFREVMRSRSPRQPFHTALHRYLTRLRQALRCLPAQIETSSGRVLLLKLLLVLDILDTEFLCPATGPQFPNDKSSWWQSNARMYRTLGAWIAERLSIEKEKKLQWLLDSTRLGTPNSTSARRLMVALKDSVHETEAQVPLGGLQDQDDEHELVPIPYEAWKMVAEVCQRMKCVYRQLSNTWTCTCDIAHAGLHFAIGPCIPLVESFVQASILHHGNGWKQTVLRMKTGSPRDRANYVDLCHDLHTVSQTRPWYSVLGNSDCHEPLLFDQFCHGYRRIPLPRDRLCLALLVAHLYLHLGGSGLWPYSRTERMIYFHAADSSTGLFHPPIFRLDTTITDVPDFLAQCSNPGMPNLALFGKLLLEIITWEACTLAGDFEQRLRSLRDNRTDLAHSGRILKVVLACTGHEGSHDLRAAGEDFTIQNNEKSRQYFIDLVIRNLEYVLLKGYQVDAADIFPQSFSPCGICTAATRTDDAILPNTPSSTRTMAKTNVPNQIHGSISVSGQAELCPGAMDSATKQPSAFTPLAENQSETVSGAEQSDSLGKLPQMAHRYQQEEMTQQHMILLNDDTGQRESVSSKCGRDATEWLSKLKPIQQLLTSTSGAPVKVAVLDTGVSLNAVVASEIYESRCEGYCFMQDPDNPVRSDDDRDGHGTHMASIILDVSPRCKLYSGRVCYDRHAVHGRPSKGTSTRTIAKAILHAVNEWKVEIISMSFGFVSSSKAIQAAIKHANDKGTVVLAAAGNSGSREPVRFPASDKNVICIHSVDGNGNPYGGNPSRQRNKDGFALLGVAVQGWAPAERRLDRRSGTSQATAMASGVAALILQILSDFQKEAEQTVDRRTYDAAMRALRQIDGMKTVFEAMCDLKDQGHVYDNVEPWRLMPRNVAPSKIVSQLCYNIISPLNIHLDD